MEWMAWTTPTAAFFIAIGLSLLVMTVWELLSPTDARRGFLPLSTTRGDRFFISLLTAAFIHLLWIGMVGAHVYIASAIAVVWAVVVLRWG